MLRYLILAGFFAFAPLGISASIFPNVAPDLDLGQFAGRWYEVASTKPGFQKDCTCVTADYSALDASTVKVVNSCRKKGPEGELSQVIGSAKTTSNAAKLNVSFGGFSLPFSNYWVIEHADDYRYAVISTPLRSPIWILSRTPELSVDDLNSIEERLTAQNFSVEKLSPTPQDACRYEAQ